MTWLVYSLLFVLALAISASAVYALYWASKTGQFRDLDAQSRSIFDASEPEGEQSDFFPGKAKRRSAGRGPDPKLPSTNGRAGRDRPAATKPPSSA